MTDNLLFFDFISNSRYLCKILKTCHSYSNQELISAAALSIFDMESSEELLEERLIILQYARKNKIFLSIDEDDKLYKK